MSDTIKARDRGGSRVGLTKDDDIELSPRFPANDVNSGNSDTEVEEVSQDQVTTPRGTAVPGNKKGVGKARWIMGKIWKTKATKGECDNEEEAGEKPVKPKSTEKVVFDSFRELGVYMGYVIILCVMSFGITSPTTYYFTKTMKDLFVDGPGFMDLTTMKDFWRYSEETLMDGLYWDKYYNDMEVPKEKRGYILFANKLLGSPRFRQLRISNTSCTIAKDFQGEVKECFSVYSKSVEMTEPFGLINGSAWNYQSKRDLKGKDIWGHISTYGGGGYVELLGLSRENASEKITVLKDNLWLDRATRAVFIEFTVYNSNVNLFCLVTLIWEFPATGGLLPNAHFKTLKLLRYVSTMDIVVFGFELCFAMYLLYYTIEEFFEIKIQGRKYFHVDLWNYFDLMLLVFGYITLFFIVYVYFEVKDILSALVETGGEGFANFTTLGKRQQLFNQFSAIFVFLAWIKLFKFMTFNNTLVQLQSTLQRCAKDIAGFSVMFFIIFMAYAQWGYLIFGTQVYDFSSYQRCMYTLFRIILGDFDFGAIEQANRIMGPVFFITYVLLVFFVLINMFLAIITDTYTTVKEDLKGAEFKIGDYFKRGYNKMMTKLKLKRENIADIQNALTVADTNNDNVVDFEEWRAELKTRGHDDAEIEAVFSKYDLDGDRVLNMDELIAMNENLEREQAELMEEMDGIEDMEDDMSRLDSRLSSMQDELSDVNMSDMDEESETEPPLAHIDDFDDVTERVNDIEKTVGTIGSKIDILLTKIDAMDRAKVKRRETLALLLEGLSGNQQDDDDYDGDDDD